MVADSMAGGATAGGLTVAKRPCGPIGTIVFVLLITLAGCSRPAATGRVAPPPQEPPSPSAPATFVNQVWQVQQSSAVASGTLYVFLSDGTLVVTAPGSKPMVGFWSRSGDGLEMVEDSIPYRVEILGLTADTFTIRSHNPGEPVDIVMVRAGVR